MAPVVTMRQLLEAGVHFGHQTRRWNPKMKRFIFGERNGIYIIDLQQTLGADRDGLRASSATSSPTAARSCSSARRSRPRTRSASYAEKCGMPYINERWLGGMLTNFETIAKRVDKMKEYERMRASGEFEAMPKKEALILGRELEKLERNLGGIRDMARRPDAVFVIDTKKEHIARHRGQQARHPGRRRRRHQLRPRRHPVRHPRQRRRHPLRHADVPDHRRRRRGGPVHRLAPQRRPPAGGPAPPQRRGRGARRRPAGRGPPPGRRGPGRARGPRRRRSASPRPARRPDEADRPRPPPRPSRRSTAPRSTPPEAESRPSPSVAAAEVAAEAVAEAAAPTTPPRSRSRTSSSTTPTATTEIQES